MDMVALQQDIIIRPEPTLQTLDIDGELGWGDITNPEVEGRPHIVLAPLLVLPISPRGNDHIKVPIDLGRCVDRGGGYDQVGWGYSPLYLEHG